MPVEGARDFFDSLAARAHEPRLADAVGTWQFDIADVGSWAVAVDHGTLTVSVGASSRRPERPGEPMSRLQMREDELLRLVRGDGHENLFMGIVRGAILVEGELAFAQRLQSMFPLTDERDAPA